MRSLAGDAALALALVTLQTSGRGTWLPGGPHPDLLLLFVLAAGMRRGESAGALWGIALGFVAETFSAGLPGASILTLGLLGFAAGNLRERLNCEKPNTQAIVAAGATLLQGLAHLTLVEVFSEGRGLVAPLLGTVVPAAAVNGALLPAGIHAWRWGRRRVRRLGRSRVAAA